MCAVPGEEPVPQLGLNGLLGPQGGCGTQVGLLRAIKGHQCLGAVTAWLQCCPAGRQEEVGWDVMWHR